MVAASAAEIQQKMKEKSLPLKRKSRYLHWQQKFSKNQCPITFTISGHRRQYLLLKICACCRPAQRRVTSRGADGLGSGRPLFFPTFCRLAYLPAHPGIWLVVCLVCVSLVGFLLRLSVLPAPRSQSPRGTLGKCSFQSAKA